MKKTQLIVWKIATVVIVFMVFSGCASNYGCLQQSRDVTKLFEHFKILDNYRYYYSGTETEPNAIIGIKNEYILVTKLWKDVDFTGKQLKNWIDRMHQTHDFPVSPYGSLILDQEGKQVGIWYSVWDRTTVKIEKDNHIVIHTPTFPIKKIMFLKQNNE